MAAGRAHSLALCANGALFAFGRAAEGQCGHGLAGDSTLLPTRVEALSGVAIREVHAAADASAARADGAAAYRWGQLAPGVLAPTPVARPVPSDGAAEWWLA